MKLWKEILLVVISVFLSTVVGVFLTPHITRQSQKPEITVDGVLPVNLYEKEGDLVTDRKLGLIFKVKNNGITYGIAQAAKVEGCAWIYPHSAANAFDEQHNIPTPTELEKFKDAHQKIKILGKIRNSPDIQDLPGQNTTYVGAIFNLYSVSSVAKVYSFTFPGADGRTIAQTGDCSNVQWNNDMPSDVQIFAFADGEGIGTTARATGLHNEFGNSNLKISLLVDGEFVEINLSEIKTIRNLRLSEWDGLSLSRFYEQPDVSEVPRE